MIRSNPSELFGNFLRERRGSFATSRARLSPDKGNVGADTVDDHNINVAMAISELHRLREGEDENLSFALETGLGHLLGLARHKVITDPEWEPLHEDDRRRLLAAVFYGLGAAITRMSDRIAAEHLQSGMLAAASVVEDLHAGTLDNDRHRDAVSRARILIHRTRILGHEEMIEERRLTRERAAIEKMLAPAKPTEGELFG
jgi:hypothetical protein